MSITLFFVLLAVISNVHCDDYAKESVKKCCQRNETLLKTVDLNYNVNYICFDSTIVDIYNDHFPLVFGEHYKISHGFPVYCNIDDLIETEDVFSSEDDNNYCVERITAETFNGTQMLILPRTVTLHCENSQSPEKLLSEIDNAIKCCPKSSSYDVNSHTCRKDEQNNSEHLLQSITTNDKYIYQIEHDIYCKKGQHIVELKQEHFSLTLKGSSLYIGRNGDESTVYGGDWCVDYAYGSEDIIVRVCTDSCSEFDAICVHKCCPFGKHYAPQYAGSHKSICVSNKNKTFSLGLGSYLQPLKDNFPDFQETIGLKPGLQCPSGKFVMQKTEEHYLNEEGFLINSVTSKGFTKDFCFETFDNTTWGGIISVETLVCFEPDIATTEKFSISSVTLPLSCVFLALTLLVYLLLPELRNLHGRTLICHVLVMLIGFGCLARVQYGYVDDSRVCTLYGYTIYFTLVAAFLWLNVMCFDIWWTFGSMRTMQPFHKKHAERRRFIWYSLYAWSLSFLFTLTMFLLDLYPVANILDANIGKEYCWFGSIQNSKTDWPHYIFFVIPVGVITFVNLILWVMTSRHCARVKSEVHRMQAGSVGDGAKKRFRADQAKYLLTVRLWVVMGAGWGWEVLSTVLAKPEWLWTIVDTINELQGVFIFVILVLKPKVFFLIRKKLGISKAEAQKNIPTYSRTSSTFLSRTISHDERTNLRTSLPADKAK